MARRAAIFQDELGATILRDLRQQFISYGHMKENEIGIATGDGAFEDADDHIRQAYDQQSPSEHGAQGEPSAPDGRRVTCLVIRRQGCRHSQRYMNNDEDVLKTSTRKDMFKDDLAGLPLPS